MLTRVKGSVWNPEDNCMPPDCPTGYGQYVLNIQEDGTPHWEKIDVGTVWPHYGSAEDIMEGWELCVGAGQLSDGRPIPDLRDRFIVMSGGTYELGQSGGAESSITTTSGGHLHSITVHGHKLTVEEMPAHSHKAYNVFTFPGGGAYDSYNGHYPRTITTTTVGGDQPHTHGSSETYEGEHEHSADHIPPYFALAFKIKL